MNLRSIGRGIAWRELWWVPVAAWSLLVVACVTTANRPDLELPAAISGATRVGNAACVECHEETTDAFAQTVHGWMRGDTLQSCEACHGPASMHIETGGEAAAIVMPNDASCLACHGTSHGGAKAAGAKRLGTWTYSTHASAGVKCTDCHKPHDGAPKLVSPSSSFRVQNIDAVSSMCLSCHQDVLGRISMPFHHPIREGAMSCTSCHDPHGNPSRELLSQNETCLKCHQAQQGPFSHEHQPVVESCAICHDPHGSPNPKMTAIAQPMLCVQCHSLTLNRHTNVVGNLSPAALRDCTACHGVVHGSDMDAYLRH